MYKKCFINDIIETIQGVFFFLQTRKVFEKVTIKRFSPLKYLITLLIYKMRICTKGAVNMFKSSCFSVTCLLNPIIG